MIRPKFKVDPRKFKTSIRRIVQGFPDVIKRGLKQGATEVSSEVKTRYQQRIQEKGSASRQIFSNITVGKPTIIGDTATVGIGNIDALDQVTEVIAKGSGATYSLWRLLEFGWGQRGGFRAGPYVIRPVGSQGSQSNGRNPGGSNRGGLDKGNRKTGGVLVFRYEGKLIFAAETWHPGYAGRHFFMDMANSWYASDRGFLIQALQDNVVKLLQENSYKNL